MNETRWTFAALALVAGALAGCAGDLRQDRGGGAAGGGVRVQSVEGEDGATHTRIDATKSDLWIYLDLETGAEVFPATPGTSPAWDLGFQRFKIKTNSGVNGSGGMEGAVLPEQDFDALRQAPASGYVVDQEDSSDEGTDPDYVFLAGTGWYSYSLGDHGVKPRDIVYVVKTVEGSFFKVQMLAYYDDAGTGGYPQFRWAPLDPP